MGTMVACFFADGSEKYTLMTAYALNTFLQHNRNMLTGLLAPNKDIHNTVPIKKLLIRLF